MIRKKPLTEEAVRRLSDRVNARGVPVDEELCRKGAALWQEHIDREMAAGRPRPRQTGPTKFAALLAASNGGRIFDAFNYMGAKTGRWTSTEPNLQNLPRSIPDIAERDAAVDDILTLGCDDFSAKYPNVAETLSGCVRGAVRAGEDRLLYRCDYSQIEARVLAWLAGEEWALETFREGRDIYCETASRILGVEVTPDMKLERTIGKSACLSLGYNAGADVMLARLKAYGVEMTREQAQAIVTEWRCANEKIVTFWDSFDRVAWQCARGGREFVLPLPSGRRLVYDLMMAGGAMVERETGRKVYGGMLAENMTQAVARDILAEALDNCDWMTLPVVMHVHDEIVVEDVDGQDGERLREAMLTLPKWADGLPLEAVWSCGLRYS